MHSCKQHCYLIIATLVWLTAVACQPFSNKTVRLTSGASNTPGVQGDFLNGIPTLPNFDQFPQVPGSPGFEIPQRRLAFSTKFKLSIQTKFLGLKACKGEINVQVWSLDGFPESQKNLANQIDLPNSYVDCSLLGVHVDVQTLARHFLSGNNNLQSGASSEGINENTVFTGLLENIASQDGLIYIRKLGDVQFEPALLMAYFPFDASEQQLSTLDTSLAAIAATPGRSPGTFAVSIESESIGKFRSKGANKTFNNAYRITRKAYGAKPEEQLKFLMPEEITYVIAREEGFSTLVELKLCMPTAGLEALMGGGGGGALDLGNLGSGPLGSIVEVIANRVCLSLELAE